jgi:hypothetical protein
MMPWVVLAVLVGAVREGGGGSCVQQKTPYQTCPSTRQDGKMVEVGSEKYSGLMEMTLEDEGEMFLVTFFTALSPPKVIFMVEREEVMVSRTCEVCPAETEGPGGEEGLTEIERLYAAIERFQAEVAAMEGEQEVVDWQERLHCAVLTQSVQVGTD